jgi:hypothetical protein
MVFTPTRSTPAQLRLTCKGIPGAEDAEPRRKTVEQGAATSVLLAGSPLLSSVGGRYFEDAMNHRSRLSAQTITGV